MAACGYAKYSSRKMLSKKYANDIATASRSAEIWRKDTSSFQRTATESINAGRKNTPRRLRENGLVFSAFTNG